jgi:hypothetical protein
MPAIPQTDYRNSLFLMQQSGHVRTRFSVTDKIRNQNKIEVRKVSSYEADASKREPEREGKD